jgi:hypothetical protein
VPVSISPRSKPRSALGGRAGVFRDVVIVAICVAFVVTVLSQHFRERAAEPERTARAPAAARHP